MWNPQRLIQHIGSLVQPANRPSSERASLRRGLQALGWLVAAILVRKYEFIDLQVEFVNAAIIASFGVVLKVSCGFAAARLAMHLLKRSHVRGGSIELQLVNEELFRQRCEVVRASGLPKSKQDVFIGQILENLLKRWEEGCGGDRKPQRGRAVRNGAQRRQIPTPRTTNGRAQPHTPSTGASPPTTAPPSSGTAQARRAGRR